MSRVGVRGGRAWPALVVVATLLVPRSASAQASFWDKARDPELARAEHVLHAVERMLLKADEASQLGPLMPDMQADFNRSALAMLELAGGSELPDVRLKFLLGDLLVTSDIGRYEEAARLLHHALEEAPDHPLAGRAWFDLGIAEAKLHKPRLEIDAYNHALRLVWRHGLRVIIYMNRGESRMVQGHLEPALADYRHAIQLARKPGTLALAYYGLGITLERNGDLPSALDAMHKANAIPVQTRYGTMGSALEAPGVFFVPPYDLFYYEALARMAAARDARAPSGKVEQLELAIGYWKKYLGGAEADHQPWVEHAKLLLGSCRRKLAKAAAEAKRSHKRSRQRRR